MDKPRGIWRWDQNLDGAIKLAFQQVLKRPKRNLYANFMTVLSYDCPGCPSQIRTEYKLSLSSNFSFRNNSIHVDEEKIDIVPFKSGFRCNAIPQNGLLKCHRQRLPTSCFFFFCIFTRLSQELACVLTNVPLAQSLGVWEKGDRNYLPTGLICLFFKQSKHKYKMKHLQNCRN